MGVLITRDNNKKQAFVPLPSHIAIYNSVYLSILVSAYVTYRATDSPAVHGITDTEYFIVRASQMGGVTLTYPYKVQRVASTCGEGIVFKGF